MFHESFINFKHLIVEGGLIFIKGRSTSRLSENRPKIIVESIESLEEIDRNNPSIVNLIIEVDKMNEDDVDSLFLLTKNHSGNSPLLFHIHDKDGKGGNFYSKTVKVSASDVFIEKLKGLYGEKNVWVE